MSSFAPLNLAEDPSVSKKDLEEEYTRELAIEQAFKTFEIALNLQNSKNFTEAYFRYKELFRLEVISNHYFEESDYLKGIQNGNKGNSVDELTLLSPNVKSLRYLSFRNRGFLNLEILKAGSETIKAIYNEEKSRKPKEKVENEIEGDINELTPDELYKELFYVMMDDFIISIIYQEPDEKLLRTIYELFVFLDNKKLARFTLEYALSAKIESDDILGNLPISSLVRKKYNLLLAKIHQDTNYKPKTTVDDDYNKQLEAIEKKFDFLSPIRNDFIQQIDKMKRLNSVEISLKSVPTWTSIISDIDKTIKSKQDKEKIQTFSKAKIKDIDPYLFTESSIDKITFIIPELNNDEDSEEFYDANEETLDPITKAGEDNVVVTTPSEEPAKKEESTPKLEPVEYEEEDSTNKPEKVIHRSSRRLARGGSVAEELQVVELKEELFYDTHFFSEKLKLLLKIIDSHDSSLDFLDIPKVYLSENKEEKESDMSVDSNNPPYISDFLKALNTWNNTIHTPALIVAEDPSKPSGKSGDDDKQRSLDILSSFGNKRHISEVDRTIPNISEYETTEHILDFLKEISSSSYHYEHCKVKILSRLLGATKYKDDSNKEEVICLLSDTVWNKALYDHVREWAIQTEGFLLNIWSNNLPIIDNGDEAFIQEFAFAVGIYEILTDTYINIKEQINNAITPQARKHKLFKLNLNALMIDLCKYGDKIDKWVEVINETFFRVKTYDEICEIGGFNYYIRFKWASIFKLKAQNTSWEENKSIAVQLQELLSLAIERGVEDLHIPLRNFTNISEITIESINYQSITASVLSMFSKILYMNSGNDEAIQILESILIIDPSANGPSQEIDLSADNKETVITLVEETKLDESSILSIRAFLDKYPIDMKLNLWNILFRYYDEKKEASKFQYGFEKFLQFLLNFIESDSYISLKGNRSATLLKIINSYSICLDGYLTHLNQNNWTLSDPSSSEDTMKSLMKFLEIVYLFKIHEEAASITAAKASIKSKSLRSFDKLYDILVQTMCVTIIYFKICLLNVNNDNVIATDKVVSEFINMAHYQLAVHHACDRASGLFLKLCQDILLSSTASVEEELAQVISCRFHYSVNINTFTPYNHETAKTGELDSNSTTELAKFVLPLCFKKNPLIHTPKSDMKSLIDGLYEVIGEPKFESDETLNLNNEYFKYFLESTTISSKFLKNTYYGLVTLDLDLPRENVGVVQDGLYYLEALLIFSSYKIRKKSMQSRAVELEHIILLLKYDLIYCTNRVESWFLLGQAFGYLVEDDLIWTSDKLTIPDRKVATANLQRKSLICYLMAINQAAHLGGTNSEQTAALKAVIGLLMSSFSKEAYSAVMKPMDMHAFKALASPRFIKGEFGASFVNDAPETNVKKKLVLKIVQQSLHIAIKAEPKDWVNYYYLSKVQRKLEKPAEVVLDSLQKSAELAELNPNGPDPIIEPHYRLCSLVYKYVKDDLLSYAKAIEFLQKDSVVGSKEPIDMEEIKDKNDFYQIIIKALKKVMAYDKKKWHHKPRYRLAQILFHNFGDVEGAKEEMSSIVTIKATSKTLVLIWKPENERPGTHFFYTYQYSRFYIELLNKELNLISLIQMLPKLRRSNSTMISLYNAWEYLCSTICKIIRTLLNVKEQFTENFLQSFTYQAFVYCSKTFLEIMKKEGVPEELEVHLCFLHAINDMKKFNNGFGPTSLIDDTITAIYIRIFLFFDKKIESALAPLEPTESPNGKMKKLAKRDVFPFANDILSSFRREIEKIFKDKPTIYNDYVRDIDAKNKAIENGTSETEGSNGTDSKEPVLESIKESEAQANDQNGTQKTEGDTKTDEAVIEEKDDSKDTNIEPAIGDTVIAVDDKPKEEQNTNGNGPIEVSEVKEDSTGAEKEPIELTEEKEDVTEAGKESEVIYVEVEDEQEEKSEKRPLDDGESSSNKKPKLNGDDSVEVVEVAEEEN